jgi:hypothetical protein
MGPSLSVLKRKLKYFIFPENMRTALDNIQTDHYTRGFIERSIRDVQVLQHIAYATLAFTLYMRYRYKREAVESWYGEGILGGAILGGSALGMAIQCFNYTLNNILVHEDREIVEVHINDNTTDPSLED